MDYEVTLTGPRGSAPQLEDLLEVPGLTGGVVVQDDQDPRFIVRQRAGDHDAAGACATVLGWLPFGVQVTSVSVAPVAE